MQLQLATRHFLGGHHQPAVGLAHQLLDIIVRTLHGPLGLVGLVSAQIHATAVYIFNDGFPGQIRACSIAQALHGIAIGAKKIKRLRLSRGVSPRFSSTSVAANRARDSSCLR